MIYNLGTHHIIKVFLVLDITYVVFKDQNRIIFILITILIGTSSTNYMTLIDSTKVYRMQMQWPVNLDQLQ